MNCVILEQGRIVLGFEANRMPDASDDIIDGVAREGCVFDFLFWRWSRCVCSFGALRWQVDILEFLAGEVQDFFDMIIVLVDDYAAVKT